MARTFEVEIDGKVRPLKFRHKDAIELKKRFNETPHRLLFLRALGLDFEHVEPGKTPHMNPAHFDPEVQFAVLHKALVRGGWVVTEDKVIDLVDEAIQGSDGKVSLADFVAPAVYCAFYSGGVTGQQVDLQETKAADAPAEGAEGNAQPSGS